MSLSRVSPYLPSFVGGALCLDFVNTVDPRHATGRDDVLASYSELVGWAEHADLLSAATAQELIQTGEADPRHAGAVYRRAVELRETLYRLLTPRDAKADAVTRSRDVERLNDEVQRMWRMADLASTETGWQWLWRSTSELDCVLWPIVRSASELLMSAQRDRVRECEGANGCGWLFVDTSKNGRRRWCDMSVCGNRAKARRRRQEQRTRSVNAE